MNDTLKNPTVNGNRKPKWWTDGIEASWNKMKADTIAEWNKVVASEKRTATQLDEGAIAFGHGARKVYHEIKAWGSDLEDKLKVDWKETAVDAEQAWDKVKSAVKHGWERTVDAVAAVPPVPPATPLSTKV